MKSLSAALKQQCTKTGSLSEPSLDDTADSSQISSSEGGKNKANDIITDPQLGLNTANTSTVQTDSLVAEGAKPQTH